MKLRILVFFFSMLAFGETSGVCGNLAEPPKAPLEDVMGVELIARKMLPFLDLNSLRALREANHSLSTAVTKGGFFERVTLPLEEVREIEERYPMIQGQKFHCCYTWESNSSNISKIQAALASFRSKVTSLKFLREGNEGLAPFYFKHCKKFSCIFPEVQEFICTLDLSFEQISQVTKGPLFKKVTGELVIGLRPGAHIDFSKSHLGFSSIFLQPGVVSQLKNISGQQGNVPPVVQWGPYCGQLKKLTVRRLGVQNLEFIRDLNPEELSLNNLQVLNSLLPAEAHSRLRSFSGERLPTTLSLGLLASYPNLKKLTLRHITVGNLDFLSDCSGLEEVELSSLPFLERVPSFTNCPNLRKIILSALGPPSNIFDPLLTPLLPLRDKVEIRCEDERDKKNLQRSFYTEWINVFRDKIEASYLEHKEIHDLFGDLFIWLAERSPDSTCSLEATRDLLMQGLWRCAKQDKDKLTANTVLECFQILVLDSIKIPQSLCLLAAENPDARECLWLAVRLCSLDNKGEFSQRYDLQQNIQKIFEARGSLPKIFVSMRSDLSRSPLHFTQWMFYFMLQVFWGERSTLANTLPSA